jgi:hypothetical protein
MAWIESHQELGAHPKTQKLARILGLSKPTVVGHLQYLWWWATDYAQDGDLGRFDALDIAIGAEWEGNPDLFVDALIRAGFVDRVDYSEDLVIHDWNDYAGKLIERRAKNAERMREARADTKTERAPHVQRTQHARARLQNRTEPNQTEPNQTGENGGAKTRTPKPLPEKGPAQVLVKTWADRSGSEPVNYGKAAGQAAQLVKAGVEPAELLEVYDWFAADPWWQEKGFDLGTCVSQLEKFRQSKRTPRTAANGRASPGDEVSNFDRVRIKHGLPTQGQQQHDNIIDAQGAVIS